MTIGQCKSSPLFHVGHPEDHIPMYEAPETPSKRIPKWMIVVGAIVAIGVAFLGMWLEHVGEDAVTQHVALPWVVPFAVLLGCIALMPFVAKHFWEHYYAYVAVGLGLVVVVYYWFFLKTPHGGEMVGGGASIAKSFGEYISFIFLLGSLYTISGGILIRVRRKATPAVNTGLLLTGAIIANIFGTTGAAMLLIRPYLRINAGHVRPYHVVFFIFLVANVGGALTPIGDPPLFLGYLKGVPFWWVMEHCWPLWAVAVGVLLAIFWVIDTLNARSAKREHLDDDMGPMISIYGMGNMLLVLLVLAGVLLHDKLIHGVYHLPWREVIMAVAVAVSLWTTPRRIHVENHFNFAPIREVAFLFLGIFATMVPALNYLADHSKDSEMKALLNTPGQYYFVTGGLSSVLDNAPTYMTFLEAELGKLDDQLVIREKKIVQDPTKNKPAPEDLADLSPESRNDLIGANNALLKYHGERVANGELKDEQIRIGFLIGSERLNPYLVAISMGAVFFGACTYIGNGPNFMVKSIAEHAGVKCPSFFGYILFYTVPVLLPTLILVWVLFLHVPGH